MEATKPVAVHYPEKLQFEVPVEGDQPAVLQYKQVTRILIQRILLKQL